MGRGEQSMRCCCGWVEREKSSDSTLQEAHVDVLLKEFVYGGGGGGLVGWLIGRRGFCYCGERARLALG